MRKPSERQIAIGALIAFAFWILVALPYLYAQHAARGPNDQQAQQAAEHSASSQTPKESFWERATNDPVAIFTLALVVFTCVLAVSTVGLWVATLKLWAAGESALKVSERAYVFIDGFDVELTVATDAKEVGVSDLPHVYQDSPELYITRLAVFPRWKNSGSTPTKNMMVWTKWDGPNSPVIPDFNINFSGSLFFLGPNATEISGMVEIPAARALVDWSMKPFGFPPQILIYGRAEYHDVFGALHFIEWCYELRMSRPDTGRIRASFIQRGEYCRTEQSDQNAPDA